MKQLFSNTIFNVQYIEEGIGDKTILLLHGYGQDAHLIKKLIYPHFKDSARFIIPNAPFPLVRDFTFPIKKNENLLKGFAWYFYDQINDRFLIDYSIPINLLVNFIGELELKLENLIVIGYSQGGYLIPFLCEQLPNIKCGIGINCSFREDRITKIPKSKIYALNGDCDIIVDPKLARTRFNALKKRGLIGEFHLIENETHRVGKSTIQRLSKILNI